jgi:hypothetical protein
MSEGDSQLTYTTPVALATEFTLSSPAAGSRPSRAADGPLPGCWRDIPAEARDARSQAVLVAQPLMDRRHPHPSVDLLHDVVVVPGDRGPGHMPQPRVGQLREPLPDQVLPLALALGRPARGDPRSDRRGDVLDRAISRYLKT